MFLRPAPLALVVAWLAIGANVATADAQWPPSGTPIATGPGDQAAPAIAPDGIGGALICWIDATTNPRHIRALRLLHSGAIAPGWVPGGNTAVIDEPYVGGPAIAPDGTGGAFIVWQDTRNWNTPGCGYDIYAQHLLGDGSVAPGWPANGLPICTASRDQQSPLVISDGAGGAVITWAGVRDDPNGYHQDLYALRVNGDGSLHPGWIANGTKFADDSAAPASLVPDGTGGAVFGWYHYTTSGTLGSDLYAQRLLGNGEIAPGWPAGGFTACGANGNQYQPAMLEDDSGGAYLCWTDERANDTRRHLYAQHVTGGGAFAPHWQAAGLPIAGYGQNQVNQTLVSDGAGGFIAAWMDYRSATSPINPGNIDVYAQKVTSSGGIAWAPEGMEVCIQTSAQWYPAAAADGQGGVIVSWFDTRFSSYPIFLQHLGGGGVPLPGFSYYGVLVPEAAYGGIPFIVPDENGGAILAWQASGSWADQDVYVAHVNGPGAPTAVDAPRAAGFSLDRVSPNPVRDLFHVSFALAGAGPATIEVLDLAGRRIDSRAVDARPTGPQAVTFDGSTLSPGVYLVRLRQGGRSEVKRISVVR